MVWYSHLLKDFPVCCEPQSKIIANEVDVFSGILLLFNDAMDFGNLTSGLSAFSKSNLYIWKVSVHVLLKTSLKDFEHYLVSI